MFSLYLTLIRVLTLTLPYCDCYIHACTILAGSCSGICMVSSVRVRVRVTVRDWCVKGLKCMDIAYPRLSNWTCLQWVLHC